MSTTQRKMGVAGIITKPAFDEIDRKYFCCCGQCHIATAARFVIVFACIKIFLHVLVASIFVTAISIFWWANLAVFLPVTISLVYGVYKGRQKFLLPFVVYNAIAITCLINLILILAIGLAANANFINAFVENGASDTQSVLRAAVIGQMLGLAISATIDARMALLIWRFRRFLIDRQRAFAFHADPPEFSHHFSVFSTRMTSPIDGFESVNSLPTMQPRKISKIGAIY